MQQRHRWNLNNLKQKTTILWQSSSWHIWQCLLLCILICGLALYSNVVCAVCMPCLPFSSFTICMSIWPSRLSSRPPRQHTDQRQPVSECSLCATDCKEGEFGRAINRLLVVFHSVTEKLCQREDLIKGPNSGVDTSKENLHIIFSVCLNFEKASKILSHPLKTQALQYSCRTQS